MFQVKFNARASSYLREMRKFDQVRIAQAIRGQLTHEPNQPTQNRKRLRPNPLAEWELRVDEFRIFYDVDLTSNQVSVAAIGHKQGSKLFVHGQEYQL
jgi:mRNA-degrading endonuclease RelE of RelBE toxin-antitoxin system